MKEKRRKIFIFQRDQSRQAEGKKRGKTAEKEEKVGLSQECMGKNATESRPVTQDREGEGNEKGGEDGLGKGRGVADITDLRRHFRRLWTIVRRLPVKLSSCKSTRGSYT